MSDHIDLVSAMEGILDRIVEMLTEQAGGSGKLEDIATIIRGERTRGLPDTPALYVVGMEAACDSTTHGLREQWTWPIGLLSLVKSDQPEDGYRSATRHAALARSVVLANRGLSPLKFVSDVKSAMFNPSSPESSEKERGYYWASAIVNVSFTIMEV